MTLRFDILVEREGFRLEAAAELTAPVTALFGPSGAGKSTLLAALAGLILPTRGEVRLDDRVFFDSAATTALPPQARRVGVVFQDGRLFPHYDVAGNLRYGEKLLSPAERRIPFGSVVDLLALGPLLGRRVQTLSGGERQRVTLGRALLSSPRLLLLDEPLAALDHGLKAQVLPFLQRVRDELSIPMLYVSHDLTEALQMSDRLLLLDRGRVTGHGRYLDLALDPEVLAHHDRLINVLSLAVGEHDDTHGITRLQGGPDVSPVVLAAPPCALPVGSPVSIAVRPEDVALALHAHDDISMRNQLAGALVRLTKHRGQAFVEVDVGLPLVAEVTQRTVECLQLEPGRQVWCLIKTNALRYLP